MSGLLQDLDRLGIGVWVDKKLAGGTIWWNEILDQIRACNVFVFVVTKESLQSAPCQAELKWAVENHRIILPVKATDVPEWRVREPLASAQIIDYTGRCASGDSGVDCLLSLRTAVERLASQVIAPAPDPAPAKPEVPFSTWVLLQPYLDADTLSLAKQEEFLRQVKLHRDDVDSDLQALVEVLGQFRGRRDIAYSVAVDVDHLVDEFGSGERTLVCDSPPNPILVAEEPREHSSGIPSAPGFAGGRTKMSRFRAPNIRIDKLADNLVAWYRSQNLEAQQSWEGPRTIVQCRSKTWARRLGAGAALTVVLWREDDELAVEIGGSKWMDKAAAGAVAWFIAWPAIIPAAIGGVKQAMLPQHTLHYIESMIPALSRE